MEKIEKLTKIDIFYIALKKYLVFNKIKRTIYRINTPVCILCSSTCY